MNNKYSLLFEPHIIDGDVFTDRRGEVKFVNDFNLDKLKRFYIIGHKKVATIRAWQAHKSEIKAFFPLVGSFTISIIKIDNWKEPNPKIMPQKYFLTCEKPQVLIIPSGYANGFVNLVSNSKLLVFSSSTLNDSISDDYRFDKDYFINCKWKSFINFQDER